MSENAFTSEPHVLEKEPQELTPHIDRNTRLVDRTLSAEARMLRKLFPNEVDREVRSHELYQIRTGFEFRQRALQMAVETKLQAVEEMCNHVLVTGKAEIRRRRQEFFAEQCLKLHEAMDDCADRFGQQLEKRFQNLSRFQSEQLRQREEERLMSAVDQFYEMLDTLGRDFIAIIDEGVRR